MPNSYNPSDFDASTLRQDLRFKTSSDGLAQFATTVGCVPNSEAADIVKANAKVIAQEAYKLYAARERKLLIVLQGMDTSGKDGTTVALFHRTPPLNVRVAPFKAPTKEELAHDFLWRVHQVVPGAGEIVVFNRSHYEDVLVVKVKGYASPDTVETRYAQINDFERLLVESGTVVLKFMLHISHEAQGESLRERLEVPEKRWKFNPDDLKDRALWPEFMDAYETMLRRTSTEIAPWYVIPSDSGRARKAIVSAIVRDELEKLDLGYPDPGHRPEDFDI